MTDELQFRGGRYRQQGTGYRAFVPTLLPPVPLDLSGKLLLTLLEAQDALSRLDGVTTTLPNANLLTLMYIRSEAVLSSQIEGTQASLDDVLRAEANLQDADDPKDVDEVLNYVAALDYGLTRRAELPLSLRLIREIHAQLLQGVRGERRSPGEFRTSQNWIGSAGATLQTATFVPPAPSDMLQALDNLEKFIYEESSDLPPLIKIALIHAQFETIHPFLDGNGRTGRLLITLLLCHYGLLAQPLLYLSYYLKLNRTEYYDRLQAIRDRGDWEGWLLFFLLGVREVARQSTEKTRAVLDLQKQDRERAVSLGAKMAQGLKVLDYLYQYPFISVRKVEEITQMSYNSANALVGRMVETGLLTPYGNRQRDRQFVHQDYLDIFHLPETKGAKSGAPETATLSETARGGS